MVFVDVDAAFDCNCDGGADGSLIDLTTCFTDDVEDASCLEIKIGQGAKFESNHIPGAMSSVTLRLISESIMEGGELRLDPYDTATEVLTTNGIDTATWTGAQTIDTAIGSSMLGDMASDKFRVRAYDDGTVNAPKIKMAECDIEFTVALIDLIAESRDDDDNLVVSCGVNLFRRTGSFPYTYTQTDSGTTNGTTGLLTFQYEDDSAFYRIFYMKELTPDQWDMSDEVQGS